jgi:hypothetical protein
MKYFLILWVCSAIQGSCLSPPITKPLPYNTYYECIEAGYIDGMQMVKAMGKEIVEKNRFFVAFHCQAKNSI